MSLKKNPSFWPSILLGLLLRFGLMLYGLWQDTTMEVKYTDVDYFVFTDAAEFITKGESPYKRTTYRYTPLLAWFLQPNIWWTSLYGKIIFIICDVISGYLIYAILKNNKCSTSTAIMCAETWLLNPLPIAISSRGNAESIMAVLVLSTLYFMIQDKFREDKSFIFYAAILFGVAVHTKIYPVTYALPFYLMLGRNYVSNKTQNKKKAPLTVSDVLPNGTRIGFGLLSAGIFLVLTGLCYKWYGMEFIRETYLYHVTRRDTRHNFSPYFYLLYLTSESESSHILGLAVFIPQLLLLVLISFKYFQDLPFCCFLHTFIFVTFNKVCTSQYFLWYLCLLPLIVPQMMMHIKEAVFLTILWFVGQAFVLAPAYFLEFQGLNTFFYIWISGLVFFLINIWILHRLIQTHQYIPLFHESSKRDLPCLMQIIPQLWNRHGESSKYYVSSQKNKSS